MTHRTLQKRFPPKPNTELQMAGLRELEIQPFIFGLCAGLAELTREIEGASYTNGPSSSPEALGRGIRSLETTLMNCGYSNRGEPYWVNPGGPNLNDMRVLVESAEACLPILNNRRIHLKRKKDVAPEGSQQAIAEELEVFEARYAAFSGACNGITALADALGIVLWERQKRTQIRSPDYMCALA